MASSSTPLSSESIPLLPTQSNKFQTEQRNDAKPLPRASFASFFRAMIPVTLIAFGGPQAHVGLLHKEFVHSDKSNAEYYAQYGEPRPSLSDNTFLELYAVCQSLPGSGSAQFATALGAIFGGLHGALLTVGLWHVIGVIIMAAAGVGFKSMAAAGPEAESAVHELSQYTVGLVATAFSLVLLAANKIVRKAVGLDHLRTAICITTTSVAVMSPPRDASWVYALLLIGGGSAALLQRAWRTSQESSDDTSNEPQEAWDCGIHPNIGAVLLFIFFAVTIYFLSTSPTSLLARLMSIFWITGACTFGGGVVVIPLLLSQIVDSGLLPSSTFLVGFGLFGCIPGPMFNLGAFLGGAIASWTGAAIATLGLMSPGIVILLGVLPFWQQLRRFSTVRVFVKGVNSVAAGLILAGVWMLMRKALVGPAAYAMVLSSSACFIVYDMPAPVNILIHGSAGVLFKTLGIGGPFSG